MYITVGIIQPYKPLGGSTQPLGDVLPYISLLLMPHLCHLAANTTLYGSLSLEQGVELRLLEEAILFLRLNSFNFLLAVEFLVFFQLLITSRVSGFLSTAHHSCNYFVHCFITAVESLVFLLPLELTVLYLIHSCVFSSECSTLR